MRVQLAGLAGAAATMLTGASAKEVEAAARIASLARANNRELHPDQARVLAELGEGASEDEKERLEDAALYLRHAATGVRTTTPPTQRFRRVLTVAAGMWRSSPACWRPAFMRIRAGTGPWTYSRTGRSPAGEKTRIQTLPLSVRLIFFSHRLTLSSA
ncbi:hypothetical protein HEQ62_10480 [Haematospirillum jordaniae]|uniref:Uncharacterized protein n=1 Tax=Haematospirillum jordaniae TaxID=1549855 RepID=A0A143DGF6_9PROT|nr:hypothetical protein [Haematospirillum jordaniae]AMW35844.1 hypothetical protein AY555_10750 [Haematospirillum jordaniae]NKD58087.1 hypothetical protein [Haematospirillum jordaniae]NKD60195.1 hypothetical protein [Haematospirillum jordaniae]NKD68085.1 hypothetical protein [Haematospirillum jordaniae]NKD79602.1 hypothetical protein [Haematospirillum jordaniae]